MNDQDPARALPFPVVAVLHAGPVFGGLGEWLPSFIHPLAFSLFTTAALQRSASPTYGVCAAGWAGNNAFEVGQHAQISGGLAESRPPVFGHTGLTRALSIHFLHEGFDLGDLLAATAGALAAAGVPHVIHHQQARQSP